MRKFWKRAKKIPREVDIVEEVLKQPAEYCRSARGQVEGTPIHVLLFQSFDKWNVCATDLKRVRISKSVKFKEVKDADRYFGELLKKYKLTEKV